MMAVVVVEVAPGMTTLEHYSNSLIPVQLALVVVVD